MAQKQTFFMAVQQKALRICLNICTYDALSINNNMHKINVKGQRGVIMMNG